MVLGDTSLHTLSTAGAWVLVAVARAVDVLVVIDRGEGQPRSDTGVEVEVAHELIVTSIGMVPLQVSDVVRAIAVHPSRVLVGDGLAISIIGTIPGEHGVHSGDGVLPIIGGLHRTTDHGADGEPVEGLVGSLETEVVSLVVEALYGTLLIVVA